MAAAAALAAGRLQAAAMAAAGPPGVLPAAAALAVGLVVLWAQGNPCSRRCRQQQERQQQRQLGASRLLLTCAEFTRCVRRMRVWLLSVCGSTFGRTQQKSPIILCSAPVCERVHCKLLITLGPSFPHTLSHFLTPPFSHTSSHISQGDVEATLDEEVAAEKWAGKKEEPEYVI